MAEPQKLRVVSLGSFAIHYGNREITAADVGAREIADFLQSLSEQQVSLEKVNAEHNGRRSGVHQKHSIPDSVFIMAPWPKSLDSSRPRSVWKALTQADVPSGTSHRLRELWWDAGAFESLSEEARLVHNEKDTVASLILYRSALDLYRGDFLAGLEMDEWVLHQRWHYQEIFRKTMLDGLRLHIDVGKWELAAELCQQALQIDPWEQQYHSLWLQILFGQGYPREASEYYRQVNERFQREWGLTMLPEVHGTFQQLQQKASPKRERASGVIDLEQFHQDLDRREQAYGPFVSDLDTFRLLCRLELRRSSRARESVVLGSATVQGSGAHAATSTLEKTLCQSLRQGDVICRRSAHQFLLLLPKLAPTDFHKVSTRVEQRFLARTPAEDVTLQMNGRPLVKGSDWLA